MSKSYWFVIDKDGEHLVIDASLLDEIFRLMRGPKSDALRMIPVIEAAFRNKGIKMDRRDAAL